jgi:hypothetical protein
MRQRSHRIAHKREDLMTSKTHSDNPVVELVIELADEDALYIDGFEECLIGIADIWRDNTRRVVPVYDHTLMVQSMVGEDCTAEDAAEYIEFNISGAYVGPYQPIIIQRFRDLTD